MKIQVKQTDRFKQKLLRKEEYIAHNKTEKQLVL